MEKTIVNLITEARIVQNSLRFLALSPVRRIRKAAIRDTMTASKGFIELIISILKNPLEL